MTDLTIIYYTDNSLPAAFAETVRHKIETAALVWHVPIVCVSQEKLDFGHEQICIGQIGRSFRSIYRQIIAGCEKARTEYVALCEHDVVYSISHFNIHPHGTAEGVYDQNVHRLLLDRKVICLYRGGRSMSLLVGYRKAILENLESKLALFASEDDFRGRFEPGKGEAEMGIAAFRALPAAPPGPPTVQICNHGSNFSKAKKRAGDWHTDRLPDDSTVDDLIEQWHLPVGD